MVEDRTELPEAVVLFGVRWKKRKGKPLQLVNTFAPCTALGIIAHQKAIADELKIPMSWVEYSVYKRS